MIRICRRGIRSAVLALLLASAVGVANGQGTEGFSVQSFKLPTDPHGYLTMNGARTLRQLQPFVAGGVSWAHNPLKLGPAGSELVEDLVSADLVAGIGLVEFGETGGVSVGIDVPLIVENHGHRFEDFDRRMPSGGFGDIRFDLKATIFDREEALAGVLMLGYLEVPSGEEEDFTSNQDKVTLGFKVGIEKQLGSVRFGFEVGYEWIDGDVRVGELQVDDKLIVKGAFGYEVVEDLWAVVEISSCGRLEHLYDSSRESPLEIDAGIQGFVGSFYLMAGAGTGLNNGYGTPDARVFAAIGYSFD